MREARLTLETAITVHISLRVSESIASRLRIRTVNNLALRVLVLALARNTICTLLELCGTWCAISLEHVSWAQGDGAIAVFSEVTARVRSAALGKGWQDHACGDITALPKSTLSISLEFTCSHIAALGATLGGRGPPAVAVLARVDEAVPTGLHARVDRGGNVVEAGVVAAGQQTRQSVRRAFGPLRGVAEWTISVVHDADSYRITTLTGIVIVL